MLAAALGATSSRTMSGERELVQSGHSNAGLDRATERTEEARQCGRDRAGTALRHRPAVSVPRRSQYQANRCRKRASQRMHLMCCYSGEQRHGLLGAPSAGERGGRQHRPQPESGQRQRVPRQVRDRPHDLLGERVESNGQWLEEPPPRLAIGAEEFSRCGHCAAQDSDAPTVERVREVDRRPGPMQAVRLEIKRPQER